jgi:hypothetical protein
MKGLLSRGGAPSGKGLLAKLRVKALRRGVWYRVLTRAERAQMELTMRVVERIRSFVLAKVVAKIVVKLLEAMESKVVRLTREMGSVLAQKLSEIAQNWGNNSARNWTADPGFKRYLAVTYLNTPIIFKS